MLLDNEDKISVRVPSPLTHDPSQVSSDNTLMTTHCSLTPIPPVFALQTDRVVEELRDRPELLHVVSSIISLTFWLLKGSKSVTVNCSKSTFFFSSLTEL